MEWKKGMEVEVKIETKTEKCNKHMHTDRQIILPIIV